ncbi:hypothetical protein O181_101333 [Austropuccinia psidii MF-1]|uniref:Uncharacterized protein n=1 Tax=Austropuccinia psidii MF-1 TaxID=1389203 RepID=A0A9Q3PH07_9BASI|nr:hypothetical protein [Austropuccinia psidii MF-1]
MHQTTSPTSFLSKVEEPQKSFTIAQKENIKYSVLITKEKTLGSENPHLRPPRGEIKRQSFNSTANLTISQHFMTIQELLKPMKDQLILECGPTHCLFNSLEPFVTMPKTISIHVETGQAKSKLISLGIVTVQMLNHNNTL